MRKKKRRNQQPGENQGGASESQATGAPASRRASRRRTVLRALLGALAVAALAFALWWFLPGRPVRSTGGAVLGSLPRGVRVQDLNILFITLDTTRADRLGCYGDQAAATPNLDGLASEGVLFEKTLAPIPLTLPAHSTIFTGTIPPFHGVRDNGGYTLDPRHETLAGLLKQRGGWSTGAFVAAYVLDARWGLNQGFDRYFDDFDLSKYKTIAMGDVSRLASEVIDAALPWLDQHASGRFFAWLHFYDPHTPYDPPEPFKTQYAAQPYRGEIAYVDSQLGRVFRWLEDRKLSDRTIIVALGDHGESLKEHGEGTHGLFVYDATLRVPLIIRAPFSKLRGRRVSSVVRSEDVMPTLLDLLGIPTPGAVQGRSLAPLMTGQSADLNLDAYAESYYARFHYGWSELRALRAGRFKYIEAPRPELYDMDQDPGETRNLYEERKPLADRMAGELRRLESASSSPQAAAGPSSVDPETRERLAALGYIGTFVDTPRAPGEKLGDPKDKIELFNMLLTAREATGPDAGKVSLEQLEKVVAADPNIIDAWMMMGNEYSRRGDPARGITYYRRALQLKPDYDLATINMAHAYRQMGNYDAAITGYEQYLRTDPKNGYVHYQLGELLMDTGKVDKAAEQFNLALESDKRIAAARNALGVVALRRGDPVTAEREIRAALEQKPDVRLAHFNLALLAEQRGDMQTAIAEYKREVDLHGDAYKAEFNLGKLYEQLGDRQAQLAAFKRAIEMNPGFAEGHLFLAKLYLDLRQNLDEAATLARRGLELAPRSEYAPLGHYVLADILNGQGRVDEAAREVVAGRALERASRSGQRKTGSDGAGR